MIEVFFLSIFFKLTDLVEISDPCDADATVEESTTSSKNKDKSLDSPESSVETTLMDTTSPSPENLDETLDCTYNEV